MAEYCLNCWNKLNERNDSSARYVMSRELDLCEGCGELKKIIIRERNPLLFGLLCLGRKLLPR